LKKIAITGASGFIGRHLRRYLIQEKYEPFVFSRSLRDGYNFISDYRELPEFEIIIHLAENSIRPEVNSFNKTYLKNEIEKFRYISSRAKEKIIYISSTSVYGDKFKKPNKTSRKLKHFDNYSYIKLANEEQTLSNNGLVLRLSNLFGEGMSKDNVVSKIINQINSSGPIFVHDERPVRDFLHVTDAVKIITRLSFSEYLGLYNVGSGLSVSIKDLINLLLKISNQSERDTISTNPLSYFSSNVIDISAMEKDIQWEYANKKYPLEERLRLLI